MFLGGGDGRISVFRLGSGAATAEASGSVVMEGHAQPVTSLLCAKQGTLLLSASEGECWNSEVARSVHLCGLPLPWRRAPNGMKARIRLPPPSPKQPHFCPPVSCSASLRVRVSLMSRAHLAGI